MRLVIQCVKHACVTVDEKIVGKINRGFMVLCGISQTDTKQVADKMVKKMCNLRVFKDENGKTNLSLADIGGELLVVSQFTLYADCHSGNRPGFSNAGKPEVAEPLYEYVLGECSKYVKKVEHGVFGAHMEVDLLNDGPFTILLDSDSI